VVLGFIPAYVVTRIQAAMGVLRIPEDVEVMGLDFAEHHAYEEAIAEITAATHEHHKANA